MKKNTILCGALVLVTGCANYHASSLSSLSTESAIYSQTTKEVAVSWKEFTKEDSQSYLGRDVIAEGYVPVQMTVWNNSKDSLFLSADYFNMPLASPEQVAQKVHTSTAGRVAAWGIGGLFIWPLLIPAVYDGIKSSEANHSLDQDYQAKALKEQTIQPYTSFNAVVFVPKEKIHEPIKMFLVNTRNQEKLTFEMAK